MKVVVITALSLALHLTLGWEWTVLSGVVAGYWALRRGWVLGAAGLGLAWLLVVGYNFVVAGGPVSLMTETLGGVLGNLPGWVIVGVTLLQGMVLGGLGGFAGTQLRGILGRRPVADLASH